MSISRFLLILLIISLPISVSAGVTADDLPEGTLWYLHADLAQMRDSESGRGLYDWMDGEIFMEIHAEVGIDINKETDSITAFSHSDSGTVIMLEGDMRESTQQDLLRLARDEAELTEHEFKGKEYYFVRDDDARSGHNESDDRQDSPAREPLQDLEDGAYFSFAVKNKLLITGSEDQMTELLANNGKVAGSGSHDGALFVLTADRAFVQAGLDTRRLDDEGDSWDSKIIRNTEMAALTIAAIEDMISIEAQLVSKDPAMAQSLGGIANGLIGLQAFNSELDPDIKSLIANTRINVSDNVLSISTVIKPEVIVNALND
jgi:hypothetical protein